MNDEIKMNDANDGAAPKRKRKKWPITVGVIAVVLIVAGAGFWVWHEQPSFCNAICHTPMDPYNQTYDQEDNAAGTDKWGNEVSNTHSMLAVSHKSGDAGATCMSCHVPQLSEQISEGVNWLTGNYYADLDERTLEDLTEARGIPSEEFCLNAACHSNSDGSAMTRADLAELTSDFEHNPHVAQHGVEYSCDTCHKAHRASVNQCTQCHEAELPDGWISVDEAKKLDNPTK